MKAYVAVFVCQDESDVDDVSKGLAELANHEGLSLLSGSDRELTPEETELAIELGIMDPEEETDEDEDD